MRYAYAAWTAICVSLTWMQPLEASAAGRYDLLAYPRTRDTLVRLPFFGGGVTQLLRYLRPREQAGKGRRSALRTALDENYVSYSGAQLWKLNFNGTRRRADSSNDVQFNHFVEEFGE